MIQSCCNCLIKNCNTMAKFKGELKFKVSFKGLGIPVGFGMTNAIIYNHCARYYNKKTN